MVVNSLKHSKEKGFHLITTNRNVYPVHVDEKLLQAFQPAHSVFQNHPYDLPALAHPVSRQKDEDVSAGFGPLRGVRGVRQHFRVDESKIFPDKRKPALAKALTY